MKSLKVEMTEKIALFFFSFLFFMNIIPTVTLLFSTKYEIYLFHIVLIIIKRKWSLSALISNVYVLVWFNVYMLSKYFAVKEYCIRNPYKAFHLHILLRLDKNITNLIFPMNRVTFKINNMLKFQNVSQRNELTRVRAWMVSGYNTRGVVYFCVTLYFIKKHVNVIEMRPWVRRWAEKMRFL